MNPAEIPVVILAGGRGARFDHESQVTPKPMIEVAGKPILEHIIDSLRVQGFRRFIVAAGYLGDHIVDHFRQHPDYAVDTDGPDGVSFRMYLNEQIWVAVAYTGEDSHTGERLLRLRPFIGRRRFVLTYGDGLSDVRMADVIAKHEKTATQIWWGEERPDDPLPAIVTLTAVSPEGRFGSLVFDRLDDWGVGAVSSFSEKPKDAWINGGFMVIEPEFFQTLAPDDVTPALPLEQVALPAVAESGRMRAYRHGGYWRCMDTRRDLEQIEADVAANGGALPWLRRDKVE